MSTWQSKLFSNSLWVLLGLVLGRMVGFLRDVFIASEYGSTETSDVVIVLLTVPDFLVGILVGGALTVVLIPEFKKLGGSSISYMFFIRSKLMLLIAFSIVSLCVYWLAVPVLQLIAPGFTAEQINYTAPLFRIVIWLVPLTVVAAVVTAYLQANNRFSISSFSTFIFNIIILVSIVLSNRFDEPIFVIAISVLIAGLVRWLALYYFAPKYKIQFKDIKVKKINYELLRHYVRAVFSGGFLLLIPFIARSLSTYAGDGSVSNVNYSLKLVDFALTISVMVIVTGVYPLIAEYYAKNREMFTNIIVSIIKLMLVVSVIMAAIIYWYSRDIAQVIYGWGKIEYVKLQEIGLLLSIAVISLPFQALSGIMSAAYNAAKKTSVVLVVNTIGIIFFVIIGYFMIHKYSLSGLMVSLVLSYLIMMVMLFVVMKKYLDINFQNFIDFKYVISIFIPVILGYLITICIYELNMSYVINTITAVFLGAGMIIVSMSLNGMHKTAISLIKRRRISDD